MFFGVFSRLTESVYSEIGLAAQETKGFETKSIDFKDIVVDGRTDG